MSWVLGIAAYYHDSACCVLHDGQLVAAAQEERFSRIKHDRALPKRAFRYCLEAAGITIADVNTVAFYEQPQKKLARQIWMESEVAGNKSWLQRLDPHRTERDIREALGCEAPIEYVDHHLAHAASSFYFSGFENAAILTIDSVGEWATTSYGCGAKNEVKIFEEVHFPDSLGLLYSTVTNYLGFAVNDGEYKVMGLAPYGKPVLVDEVRTLVENQAGGGFRLNLKYFDFHRQDRMYSDNFEALLGMPARVPDAEILPFHLNLARSLQHVLEEILLGKSFHLMGIAPSENLCLAGGVALNCVANSRLRRDGPFRRVFIPPAAGDAGTAIGAAAIAYIRRTGEKSRIRKLRHAFWGPAFTCNQVRSVLDATPIPYIDFSGRENTLLKVTADHLAEQKVVGWFQGRMEFGPRALGGRSILADPRDSSMRSRVNTAIKKREVFRPFAPAVLEQRASSHFDIDHAMPFMVETCQVRSAIQLPAITHVDNSARVQTVSEQENRRFAGLLAAFEQVTGCPILLNTSFNVRDEPIVCTPADAIRCFVRSGLDVLVIEDFLLERSAIPSAWLEFVGRFDRRPPVSGGQPVYTLVS